MGRRRRAAGSGHLRRKGPRGYASVPAGDVWEPSQLSNGLHYWDLASGVTTSMGDVTAVADQVGSADMVTTGSPPAYEASQAIFGGAPAADFIAGSSETLRATLGATRSQAYTKWIVGSWSSTGLQVLWGCGSPSRSFLRNNTSLPDMQIYAGGTVARGGGSQTIGAAYLYVAVMSDGAAELIANGSAVSLSSTAIGTLGADRFEWAYDGFSYGQVKVAAGGVVSGVMSSSDRAALLAWAQSEKGVP